MGHRASANLPKIACYSPLFTVGKAFCQYIHLGLCWKKKKARSLEFCLIYYLILLRTELEGLDINQVGKNSDATGNGTLLSVY